MKKIDAFVSSLTVENNYSFYLSFFRIFSCLLLLKQVIFSWGFLPLLYTDAGYLAPMHKSISEFFISFDASLVRDHIYTFFGVYILFLILMLFGVGKNFTAVIVFLLYDIIQKLCPQILNGGDNFLRFILLYLAFADSFHYFSISGYKSTRFYKLRCFTSNLAGISICMHLCLIYFISAIHKIHADVWFNGVATYYTFNIERFNGTAFNTSFANSAVFVALTTYGTWLLELLYPILIWNNAFKKYLVPAAILLHLGIGIFMMLYDFQLIFILVQGFFFTNQQWLRAYHRFKAGPWHMLLPGPLKGHTTFHH
jgi:hypothetical protein